MNILTKLNKEFKHKQIKFFCNPKNADEGVRIVFTDNSSIDIGYSACEGFIKIENKATSDALKSL